MNKKQDTKLETFTLELENHSPEGIEILSSEPSKLINYTIYLFSALIFSVFAWAFVGVNDDIVIVKGTIAPDSKVKRIYTPLDGELIDVYINEGMSVKKNDVIAKIYAPEAIRHTDSYMNSKFSLASKERELKRFLAKKNLKEQKAESMRQRYLTQKNILDHRTATSVSQMTDDHNLKVQNQHIEIQKFALELEHTKNEKEKFERLYNLPAKGGISNKQLTEKLNAYSKARGNYTLAKNKIGELENKFNKVINQEKDAQLQSELELEDSRIDYEYQLESIKKEEALLRDGLLPAKLRVESTARITHENIDKDGFLKILSPYSGIITEISFNQPGVKVQSRTPLASIVPENSKTILEIEIPESKRALLRVGLVVKLKVNAFKYQRYGFITGKLEYISPTTRISQHTKKPYYKGRVSLDKIAFLKNGIEYPLHFGMTAIAEIVVRQRRIIDIVLDPIQG